MTDTILIVDQGCTEILVTFKAHRTVGVIEECHGVHYIGAGWDINLTSVEVGFKGGEGIEVIDKLNDKQKEHIEHEVLQTL
jgi:hypothetical protein